MTEQSGRIDATTAAIMNAIIFSVESSYSYMSEPKSQDIAG